uniref:SJCHGC09790 protein n=1 Tax=Schistosoma japonicum TaxID=6182 RepID=Q5BQV9_SCHJA|nr:SJCHGC09790 protein [Schistosoma japonicum]
MAYITSQALRHPVKDCQRSPNLPQTMQDPIIQSRIKVILQRQWKYIKDWVILALTDSIIGMMLLCELCCYIITSSALAYYCL